MMTISVTDGYSLISLINDWHAANFVKAKNEIIAAWGMELSSGGLMFVFAPDNVAGPRRTVHVKDDMSIELRCTGKLASFPVYDKPSCFNEVYRILEQVGYGLKVCIGSDDTEKCPQIYFIKKLHSNGKRCENCQVEYRKKHDRRRKRETYLNKNKKENVIKKTITHQDKGVLRLSDEDFPQPIESTKEVPTDFCDDMEELVPEENLEAIKKDSSKQIHIEFAEQCIDYAIKYLKQCSKTNLVNRIMFLEGLKKELPTFE
ncbi:unnamed protein product [Brassicogethes aeneus]|uniref:Uncharacterized protein n=1 Tax=Brassicogethes aeneus TaxID=1431903 RepID=A0A9P0FIG9_BRAAE|nr:unnamed protein product [Brassicogethes aeneus]